MKQYIDFFESQRLTIEKSCPALLNSYRNNALDSFKTKGFPVFGSEDYQHIDIPKLLDADFGFHIGNGGSKINPHKVSPCNLPNVSSVPHFLVNGHYYPEEVEREIPQGVFSGSLNTFAEQYPEIFSKYYNRLAEKNGNGLSDFNTLFVQDGYVLYVPKNVIVENPIQLTNLSDNKVDSLVNRRILIILEAGAQAKLLVCDHAAEEKTTSVVEQVTELFIEENAVFDFYELEESSRKTIRLTNTFVRQSQASNVLITGIVLNNGTTRNNYQIDLDGENAETHLSGMMIIDEKQKADNFSVINHNVPNCHSNELFKYVLDGESIGSFNGKIKVAPNAQKTQSHQNNRNLLGNKDCRMYSKPQLIIDADDVKCSHGMTTGQLDEKALFYMRSRGISESEAILLLKYAFTDDILQSIRVDGLKSRLKLLIEKRFRGELVKCQGCGSR